MQNYLYLLRKDNDSLNSFSAEEKEQHMGRFFSWMEEIKKSGHMLAGEPLDLNGSVVRKSDNVIIDGPFSETKEAIGGYFIIKADSLEEATKISKGCPIFEVNGSIEVRPIMEMEMKRDALLK